MILFGRAVHKKHTFDRLRHEKHENYHAITAQIIEKQVLQKYSGLKLGEELHIIDVPIVFQGENHFIHTYACGGGNPETMVLVHGYGGSSLLYYPMLKDLAEKYRVFCIDLLGMGLSSRPEFNCKSTQETIEYFVESIEKWREAMGIEDFQLVGHSLGGYLTARYAIKYQHRVKKLLLISPAGVTKYEDDGLLEHQNSQKWLDRKKESYHQKYWKLLITPAEFFRMSHGFGKFILKKYVKTRFGEAGREKKLRKLLYKFCCELLMDEKGSERAIFFLLKPPVAGATLPLEDDIASKLTIPVVFYYGSQDWIDPTGAERIVQSGKRNFKVKEVPNSGHQMIIQSPKLITQEILMDGLNLSPTELVMT